MRKSLALAGMLALATACFTTPKEPEPQWQGIRVESPSREVLWQLVMVSAASLDYPQSGEMDPAEGKFTTGWKTNLSAFSRKGYRKRAQVELHHEGEGIWRIRAHVQVQRNMTLSEPLDPSRAEWKWADEDEVEARILLRHVASRLNPEGELDSSR